MAASVTRYCKKKALVCLEIEDSEEVNADFYYEFIVPLDILSKELLFQLHLDETAWVLDIEKFKPIFDYHCKQTETAKMELEKINQRK